VASEHNDDGSIPALATLVRGVGAAAGVAQTLLRAAGGALSSAVGAVVERAPRGLRRRSSALAPTPLRAIAGGAARARSRHDGTRPVPETMVDPPNDALLGDDAAPLLDEDDDEDRVVVLVRDPRSIFAYWHLGSQSRARRDHLRAGSTLLRDALQVTVADASGVAPESWIVPAGLLAESAHVDLGGPRATVRVAVGLYGEGARFEPLAESPAIALPPSTPAALEAPRWRRLPIGEERAASPPLAPPPEVSDELLVRAAAWARPSSHSLPLASGDAAPPHDATGRAP
jgi:hypothetical protein